MSEFGKPQEVKPHVLLHSCCGPCSTSVIERLLPDYNITVFFFNPNITDSEEYEKRKQTQIEFLEKYSRDHVLAESVGFIEGEYDPQAFFEAVRGLENEREGGKRCVVCERMRLERTAVEAEKRGFDIFATTLTVSPHKNYEAITMIGTELAIKHGLSYLDIDFKKRAGFQRSVELSKAYNLYRQNFCGCIYSKHD
ncbi:MAG: epoxyqueuosine reductase QueH [Clostridia bacterium]|nr:epoxyqueuosine reductase QueH [Clostridia bacterium]